MHHYNDMCDITCTNNNNTITAEVLEYKPRKMLTASVNRQIKVLLRYNDATKDYRGSAAGMQFESAGPDQITKTRNTR